MSGDQFLDQGLQLGKLRCCRKQLFLLGGKMKGDFLLEYLLNLGLPCLQVDLSSLDRPVQADAQRQAVLVLVGERDKVLIAKHVYLLSAHGSQMRNQSPIVPADVGASVLAHMCRPMHERGRSRSHLAVWSDRGRHGLGLFFCPFTAGRSVSQSVRTLSHS